MSAGDDPGSGRLWFVASTLTGVAAIAGGVSAEAVWGWDGASIAIAINLGTALALAGLLFRIERRFAGGVAEVQASLDDVQAAVDGLAAQPVPIDQVGEAAARHLDAERQDRRERIAALDDGVDEARVRRAVEGVAEVDGLVGGQLTVRTGASLRDPRLSFGWSPDGLTVRPLAPDGGATSGIGPALPWRDGQAGQQIAGELRTAARSELAVDLGEDFAWWELAITWLRVGLGLALDRQEDDRPPLAEIGPHGELLVTSRGVEHRTGAVLVAPIDLRSDPLVVAVDVLPDGVTSRQVKVMAQAATVHLPVSRLGR